MVIRLVVVVAVAGCTENIVSGAYLCGTEQLCPDGLVCNGPDNVCVLANEAQPFACGDAPDPAGDDSPAQGSVVASLACVSPIRETTGCLLSSDIADWYQFDVPGNCTAVQVEARVTFPIAFEPLAMQRSTDGGPAMAAETPCATTNPPQAGETARCFKLTVENGSHQAIGLVHSDTSNCGGDCANNRYTLSLQLSTP